MRLQKNITRAVTFTLVGALSIAGISGINQSQIEETSAISGSWGDYLSTVWYDTGDSRYSEYRSAPGSSEDQPYLIRTAEEFSGLRSFEGTEALAGKFIKLTNSIDLSAHYWDPIELYGSGHADNDAFGLNNGFTPTPVNQDKIVSIDGGNYNITGMSILNTYDKITYPNSFNFPAGNEFYYGATGLFSFAYKTRIANIRLVQPTIILTETAGYPFPPNRNDHEIPVIDIVGAVVGTTQNALITDVHVTGLNLDYTASFGDYVGPCEVEAPVDSLGNCPYYAPMEITVGGIVGSSTSSSVVQNSSVNTGSINVAPQVDETIVGAPMTTINDGDIFVGGIVGKNYRSLIMNACSDLNINFTDEGYNLVPRNDDVIADSVQINFYRMQFGGIAGGSFATGRIDTCVYNSCSHSNLNIDAAISPLVMIGGVIGLLVEDSMVNTYFDGAIIASEENYSGEIVGAVDVTGVQTHTLKSNYYLNRGNDPVGIFFSDPVGDEFSPISTTQKLVSDLNKGRDLVIADLMTRTTLDAAAAEVRILTWAIQDGSGELDCSNTTAAGLVFPNDKNIDAPNTGGHL